MPVNYPKFDKKIQDQIDNTGFRTSRTRPGVVMSYDKVSNTAVVALDEQFSDAVGNIIRNVPCPFVRGVQVVAPTMGTRCLVGFRDNNETNPYIINYFDDGYSKLNHYHNTVVRTGIPRYMVH
jgi:hypothetical protein